MQKHKPKSQTMYNLNAHMTDWQTDKMNHRVAPVQKKTLRWNIKERNRKPKFVCQCTVNVVIVESIYYFLDVAPGFHVLW